MEYKYRVSVIIPIYNSEKYLEWCVNSVLTQQGPLEDYEVLLVNDGSTDSSAEICDRFAEKYPNVRAIHKPNEKLSATRNRGMREAQGKYFCFLDSDDALLPHTIDKIADFFDEHYDEIDLVSYPQIDILRNGKIQKHFRYDLIQNSGVYDLVINPYITQTRVNVFSKNKGLENNVYFDTTPDFRHEDSCYNTYVLKDKLKIGCCNEGGYIYALNNDNITANYFYAYYIFETSIKYYEQLFAEYKGKRIPRYVQAIVLNDLSWKFRANKLYPYHYSEDKLEEARKRVERLVEQMDVDVLFDMPHVDLYHRHHFLKMKVKDNYHIIEDSDRFGLFAAGERINVWRYVTVNLQKFSFEDNMIQIYAAVKHPICFYKEVEVWVMENDDASSLRRLNTTYSTYSYNAAKEKITDFRRFVEKWDMDKVHTIKFLCKIDNHFYPVRFTNTKNSLFNGKYRLLSVIRNGYRVSYKRETGEFYFKKLEGQMLLEALREQDKYYEQLTERLKLDQEEQRQKKRTSEEFAETLKAGTSLFDNIKVAEKSIEVAENDFDDCLKRRRHYMGLPQDRNIWLYNDANTNIENGLMQFRHDLKKDDGVERFYVYDNEFEAIRHHFREEELDKLVKFGSDEHKELFMQSSVILTAYAQRNYYCPFNDKEALYFKDLWHYKVVYLQHGILHAFLPWQYGNDRIALDKIVVSSEFEKKNMLEKYAYREEEFIDSGMVRMDYIDREAKPKNRILLAPSWRHYLIGDITNNRWTPQEGKFLKSEYYQEYDKLFHDKDFIKMLEDNDLYLDFKLHPIFECYAHLFKIDTDRICLAPSAVNLSDYKICITDFSSFVFDFVYCGKPVLYFMPDYDKFCSGMHTYRTLDIPLEEGFGKLAIKEEELAANIKEIVEDNYNIPEQYKEISNSFFTQYENHGEDTYQALKKAYLQ